MLELNVHFILQWVGSRRLRLAQASVAAVFGVQLEEVCHVIRNAKLPTGAAEGFI